MGMLPALHSQATPVDVGASDSLFADWHWGPHMEYYTDSLYSTLLAPCHHTLSSTIVPLNRSLSGTPRVLFLVALQWR
jgi:hypothetical protein